MILINIRPVIRKSPKGLSPINITGVGEFQFDSPIRSVEYIDNNYMVSLTKEFSTKEEAMLYNKEEFKERNPIIFDYSLPVNEIVGLSSVDLGNSILMKAKEEAIEKVNPYREGLLNAGFPFMDKMIQSNELSKSNLTGYMIILDQLTFPISWRTADDTTLEIPDDTTFTSMSMTMLNFIETIMSDSWDVKDSIKSSITTQEVDSIIENYLSNYSLEN